MAEKKLSKKALSSGFHRWYYGNLTCFSQEHMQTFGYLCSMLPLCKELYADEKMSTARPSTVFVQVLWDRSQVSVTLW